MNAVGIDVSKGKSMMMALQPMNQVVLKPREYSHTKAGLGQMAHDILRLGEETWVIMEATGRYHEPVAAALHEYGIRVTVMNPLFIKQSGSGSIRKVKTDKADAKSGWISSRPSGTVSVSPWSVGLFSRNVTASGASGRGIISAALKRRSCILAASGISQLCLRTATPS